MAPIIYIDPQSYNNLSLYDCGMLSAMGKEEVILFGSSLWDCQTPNVELRPWFTYNKYKKTIIKGLSYTKTILKIASYIYRHKEIKVAHIQWLRLWKIDFYFLKWLKQRGIKVIFTAHNLLPHDTGDTQREQYSRYYKMVDCICVHTESTKQDLQNHFGIESEKIEVIPHGVITSNIPEDDIIRRADELRKQYGIDRDKLILSSLGLQSYYKGVDLLIKLWISDDKLSLNKSIKLMLIGRNSGLDYSGIKNCENVVIVDEKVSNLDFQAFLELSDIVLLPYRQISQSGVLFSAIARNKPVLVSNVGGLPDPLNIGQVGWNIGKATEENIRTFLNGLVTHSRMVKNIQSNLSEFEKVRDFYSWESISRRLYKLYHRLMSE